MADGLPVGTRRIEPAQFRVWRERLGLSQAHLARALGVSANTVARWERGEQRIAHPALVRLALERLQGVGACLPLGSRAEQAEAVALPAPSLPGGTPPHLAAELSSFIGREREVAQIEALLTSHRLVTLTGLGGVGKTRLALRATARIAEEFADGSVFVPLAPIREPALVTASIAQALHLREEAAASPFELLQDVLRDQQLLLVLDNFEQVLSAAPLVAALLSACPKLKALVTSREALRLSGEHIYLVPTMQLPERSPPLLLERLSRNESVRLFTARAEAARTSFVLTNETAPAVAEICWRLDGLPLAIELAAARVQVLSPAAILARLGRRLDLLVDGSCNVPERHQTLRAAISWSYDLLNATEQEMFRALGVFVGGCTLETISAVCSAPTGANACGAASDGMLRVLSTLTDQGLVQMGGDNGEPRFGLLDTVREYALECLAASGDELEKRKRHALYFLAQAEALGSEDRAWGPDGQACLDQMEQEHDNLRAALRWAIDSRSPDTTLRLTEALRQLWYIHGHFTEGRRWIAEVLALPEAGVRTRARASLLNAAAMQAYHQADYSAVEALDSEALGIGRDVNDHSIVGRALQNLGMAALSQGKRGKARKLFEEALALHRLADRQLRAAQCLHDLALVAYHEEDYGAALAHGNEALAIARERNSVYIMAMALRIVGFAAQGLGDHATARSTLENGLALARQVDAQWVINETLEGLGRDAVSAGRYAAARVLFGDSLEGHRQLGRRLGIARCLEGLASLDARAGQLERAVQLAGAAAALRDVLRAPLSPRHQRTLEAWLGPARQRLGQIRVEKAWTAGGSLSVDESITLARAAGQQLRSPAAAAARTQPFRAARGAPTNRERDVLRLLAEGMSNLEIAAELVLSVRTVERHISNLYAKIGVRGRAHAMAYALRVVSSDNPRT